MKTHLGDDDERAFKAGFVAHPDAEAWSFDPKTCMAADREESAWKAWLALQASSPEPKTEIR